MALLKNQAAMQVVATHPSLLARVGPLEPNQITEAAAIFRTLYNQHAQFLAATVVIAGPSLNAVGGAPVFPSAIRTYSWCFDGKGPSGGWWTTWGFPKAKTGATPSVSNYAWSPDNAGSNPAFWSDLWIQSPISGTEAEAFSIVLAHKDSAPGVYVAGVNLTALKAEGFLTRSLDTKFELITGHGTNQIRTETTWGVYVTTIALPLLYTYQSVLRNLSDRLKATYIENAEQRKAIWTMLMSCSVEVTEFTLDKLEVLRDPIGSPIYLPPATVSLVRDNMMASVVDSFRVILPSERFKPQDGS